MTLFAYCPRCGARNDQAHYSNCTANDPSAAPSCWEIPKGWKLVPIEPTEAMLLACQRQWKERVEWKARTGNFGGGDVKGTFLANYRAMLAASPTPPSVAPRK